MTVKIDRQLKAQMKDLIVSKLRELQEERKQVIQEHEEYIKKFPPRFSCDRGCQEAAVIAQTIEVIVEVGILLGILPKNFNADKYL